MAKVTMDMLGTMVANGFHEVLTEMRAGFGSLDARVTVLEAGQKEFIGNFGRFERGQEDILVKLDSKADKIDFPEKYPQYRPKPMHRA